MKHIKLCIVAFVIFSGLFIACGTTGQQVEGWAKTACSFVEILPEASSSTFPSEKKLTMTITSSSIKAVVTEPSVSAVPSVYERSIR